MRLFYKNALAALISASMLFLNTVNAEIVFTHEGDSIAYDESNNHYIIRYVGRQGGINEVIWHPFTDVNVEIKADYNVLKNSKIKYEYKLKVGENSKLDLNSFYFYAFAIDKLTINAPDQWRSSIRNTYDSNDPEQRISWHTSKVPAQSGKKVKFFEIKSMSLPVYRSAFVRGKTETLRYVDNGPNAETQGYFHQEILAKHFNGKGVNTAIPLIPVSVPFNSVETYTAFHKFLIDYIEKDFIDISIAASLTDTSAAVLTALTANDIKGALSNLKAVKKLVEGEDENHKNNKGHDKDDTGKPKPLIVKELRKILKFNLKFIKKKLKGESVDN